MNADPKISDNPTSWQYGAALAHPHSTPEMRRKAALNVAARVAGSPSTPESREACRDVLSALGLTREGIDDDDAA